MNVQGLLYRTSGNSSGPSSRGGIMAPHMDSSDQPYVSAHHQMSDFDSFPAAYGFDASQVQYHNVNVLHSPTGLHPHYQNHQQNNAHHTQHQQQYQHAQSQSHHQHQQHHQQQQQHQHNPQIHHQAHHHQQVHQHQQSSPSQVHQHQQSQLHHVQHQHQQHQQQQQQQSLPISVMTTRRQQPSLVPAMSARDVRNSTPRTQLTPTSIPQKLNSPPRISAYPYSQHSQHMQSPSPPLQQALSVRSDSQPLSIKTGAEIDFKTDVDTLMKAIQAKQTDSGSESPRQMVKSQPLSPSIASASYRGAFPPYGNNYTTAGQQQFGVPLSPTNMGVDKLLVNDDGSVKDDKKASTKARKRYECEFAGCNKSFFQKTHLEIHTRAHSGDKPYPCTEPGCGQRFSQMGNLKTHQRRHTGERPFSCDHCGKKFAQRGNVRAHKIVHQGAKPYTCKLDNCLKQFTQLGNLKSHQNKFHAAALRNLTEKFATRDVDNISSSDRELFEYFADLYKNSNKGIKGRGKDRKISGSKKSYNTDDDMSRDDMITSPTSCGSGSQADDYGFQHDMDDDSTAESPYHDGSQHLPPLRAQVPNGIVMGNFGDDGMNMTDMAKFRLDGKFQV